MVRRIWRYRDGIGLQIVRLGTFPGKDAMYSEKKKPTEHRETHERMNVDDLGRLQLIERVT